MPCFTHTMEAKKLLFVVPYLCVGGVSRSLLALLGYLPPDTYDVTLLLFSREAGLQSELPDWVRVRYSDAIGRREALRGCISKLLQTGFLRPFFRTVKAMYHKFGNRFASGGELLEERYDVAIAYQDGLATWYVATHPDVSARRIAFVHTDFVGARYDVEHERETYRSFEQICFGSEASRLSFLKLLPEYKKQTLVVPNVINRERILQLSQDGDGFCDGFSGLRILTVGRLSREKGIYKIPKLVGCLEALNVPFRWYLIGEGPAKAEIEGITAVNDNLVLLGMQKNPYPFMRQCDIYVQPSDYEGYCIALAEARVLCRPCVVCDFSGAREQLKNGVTGLVTGFNVDDLFDSIGQLLCNPAKRQLMTALLKKENSVSDGFLESWIHTI